MSIVALPALMSLVPIFIFPKVEAIEPAARTPTVVNVPLPLTPA